MCLCVNIASKTIIIALTSEDTSIELLQTLSKLLQNTVCGYYYSFKSRTAVSGRCVTTAVC